MRSPRLALGVALLGAALPAQLDPGHIVVLTARNAGPARSQLLDVDPASGTFQPVGRFPSDPLPPLAVAVDPVDRHLLVAVDEGSSSRIVRLQLAGRAVVRETRIARVSGRLEQLGLGDDADLLALVGGASGRLLRVGRRDGAVRLVATLPGATAMETFELFSSLVTVAQAGSAQAPPQIVTIDGSTGAVLFGPSPVLGLPQNRIEGLIDLPTAVPRQVVALPDATVWMHTGFGGQPAQPLNATPALPAGGTTALRSDGGGFAALAVGNRNHPFVSSLSALFGPQAPVWTTVAGPLPGDPIDLATHRPQPPAVVPFGSDCGAVSPLRAFSFGVPQVGNASFALGVAGARPQAAVLLLLGSSERVALGVALPFTLPGGCPLLVSPDAGLTAVTGAGGVAQITLPVPNQASLAGAIVYGQFLQPEGAGWATSAGQALHVGL